MSGCSPPLWPFAHTSPPLWRPLTSPPLWRPSTSPFTSPSTKYTGQNQWEEPTVEATLGSAFSAAWAVGQGGHFLTPG